MAANRNPLFADQLGDERCPPSHPWFREGRCWRYHTFDTAYESTDSTEPITTEEGE